MSLRAWGFPFQRFVLPFWTSVLTPLTVTPNSASTAALISGLEASRATLNTTASFSERSVAFSVISGATTTSSCRLYIVLACFFALSTRLQPCDCGPRQHHRPDGRAHISTPVPNHPHL